MTKLFDIIFLQEAFEFLSSLEKKHYEMSKYGNAMQASMEICELHMTDKKQ